MICKGMQEMWSSMLTLRVALCRSPVILSFKEAQAILEGAQTRHINSSNSWRALLLLPSAFNSAS